MSENDTNHKRYKRKASEMEGVREERLEQRLAKRQQVSTKADDKDMHKSRDTNLQTRENFRLFPFHLQMLRALYDDNKTGEDEGCNAKEEEGVDDKIWDMAHKYLKERDKLSRLADEANYYKGIHDEALSSMKTIDFSDNLRSPISSSPWSAGEMKQVMDTHTSILLSQTSPSSRRYSSHPMSQSADGISFGVVSCLMDRRYRISQSNLQHHIEPFQPLLFDVEKRLETLKTILQAQSKNPTKKGQSKTTTEISANNFSVVPDSRTEENIARIETKINLWSRLLHELRDRKAC